MQRLYTIGYEGADLTNFIETLKTVGIDVLLDVREIPISRRQGFSKTALREALEDAGIDYRHEKQLGSPKVIRHKLREDGNYNKFFRAFEQHLNKQTELLNTLIEELTGNIALMCYERDATDCHRSAVADALSELTNRKPKHLGVQGHEQRKAYQKAHSYPGQGVPAGEH